MHGFADGDFAAVGLLFACNEFKQGGFTRTVGADDAHNGASGYFKAQVVNEKAVAKRFADVFELNDFMPQALGYGDENFLRFVAFLVFVIAQFFKACQTRFGFGLAAFGVLARPFQLFFHRFGAGIFGFLLLHQAGFFLLQPCAVVAFPRYAVAAVKLQNPLGSVVQEVAVVGDGYYGAREAGEKLLQPMHAFCVQVVGGLIEQQHIGLGEQQAAQRYAAFFATREVFDNGIPRGQAQCVGGNFEQVLALVGTSSGNYCFKLGLLGSQGIKVCIGLGIGGVHFFKARLCVIDFTHAAFYRLTHGFIRVELRLLR